MKKFMVLISVVLLIVTGCTTTYQPNTDSNAGMELGTVATGMGSTDGTFNKQKLTYDITINNPNKLKIKEKLPKPVLTKWTKQNVLEKKVTKRTFNDKSFEVKGYIIIHTQDMGKKDINKKSPFIKGVEVVDHSGKKHFVDTRVRR